jgi:hypothetical protein
MTMLGPGAVLLGCGGGLAKNSTAPESWGWGWGGCLDQQDSLASAGWGGCWRRGLDQTDSLASAGRGWYWGVCRDQYVGLATAGRRLGTAVGALVAEVSTTSSCVISISSRGGRVAGTTRFRLRPEHDHVVCLGSWGEV